MQARPAHRAAAKLEADPVASVVALENLHHVAFGRLKARAFRGRPPDAPCYLDLEALRGQNALGAFDCHAGLLRQHFRIPFHVKMRTAVFLKILSGLTSNCQRPALYRSQCEQTGGVALLKA